MSYEFLGTTTPPITGESFSKLVEEMTEECAITSTRRESGVAGFDCLESGNETMTLALGDQTLYVAFHAATGEQRSAMLSEIDRLLAVDGISCVWSEE